MNEKYFTHKGDAIVFDENGNATIIPNSNNLEKILEKENLIENLEEDIERIKKIMSNIRALGLKKRKNFAGLICFGFCTFLTIFITAAGVYEHPEFNRNLSEIINNNAYIIQPLTCISLIASPIFHFIGIQADPRKKFNGYKCRLMYLNAKLSKEKEELAKLKQNSRVKDGDKIPVRMTTIKEDIDKLLSLKRELTSCYDIGYDVDKYSKYLENGTLDEKISDMQLGDSGTQLIKKFISEQKRPN